MGYSGKLDQEVDANYKRWKEDLNDNPDKELSFNQPYRDNCHCALHHRRSSGVSDGGPSYFASSSSSSSGFFLSNGGLTPILVDSLRSASDSNPLPCGCRGVTRSAEEFVPWKLVHWLLHHDYYEGNYSAPVKDEDRLCDVCGGKTTVGVDGKEVVKDPEKVEVTEVKEDAKEEVKEKVEVEVAEVKLETKVEVTEVSGEVKEESKKRSVKQRTKRKREERQESVFESRPVVLAHDSPIGCSNGVSYISGPGPWRIGWTDTEEEK
jgi:hypothetical protein